MRARKHKDYFWRAPNLNVYRIAPYWGAPNLHALYYNGTPIYISCEKSAVISKLREIKSNLKRKSNLKYKRHG